MFDLSINITNTPHANSLVWAGGEWDNIHKITEQYEYSATKFENGKRKNNSAVGVGSVALDFDEGITLEEGLEISSSSKSVLVTTKSHNIEKNGVIADRFRIIFFLNFCFIDMNYYSQLMKVIIRFFGADIACSDSARYYSPNPKQQVYYSDSEEIFDITRFEAMIDSREVVQKHIVPPKKEQKQNISSTLLNRVELSSLLDVKVEYYHFGMRTVETLEKLIANTEVSDTAIKCHCFLNEQHEDRNPSCYIYHNEHSIYAKCVSCQIDGLIKF